MAAGRSRDQVDVMTWPDVEDIFDYWLDYPPTNEILTAIYGIKSAQPRIRDEVSEAAEIKRIKSLFPKSGAGSIASLQEFAKKHQKLAS